MARQNMDGFGSDTIGYIFFLDCCLYLSAYGLIFWEVVRVKGYVRTTFQRRHSPGISQLEV